MPATDAGEMSGICNLIPWPTSLEDIIYIGAGRDSLNQYNLSFYIVLFFQEISINISESAPSDTGDEMLVLKAQSFMPNIDFKDIENIFQEHYICQFLNEFESPLQVSHII